MGPPITFSSFRCGLGLAAVLAASPAALAATPPVAQPKVISRGEAAGSYQAFPDVCRLQNGDLLCVFYGGYDHISLPKANWSNGGRICSVRSSDEGRTWSAPQILFDGPLDDRDPHIAQMKDGSVLVVYYEEGSNSAVRARRFRLAADTPEFLPLDQ